MRIIEAEEIREVILDQDLTTENARDLKSLVEDELKKSSQDPLLFNLENVKFLDSSGISTLVGLHRRISKAGFESAIYYQSPVLEETFALTKLNRLFTLFQDRDEALDFLLS